LCRSPSDKGFLGLTQSPLLSGKGSQAKVENLHAEIGIEHDVGRLDVAMIDPGVVRLLQALGDLTGDVQQLRWRQSAALQELLQRLTDDQLHGNKGKLFRFVHLINGRDVGMV
jgi:hypothetical protein